MKKTILQKFREEEAEPELEDPPLSPTPGPSREIDNYDNIGFIIPSTPLNLDAVNLYILIKCSINQYLCIRYF